MLVTGPRQIGKTRLVRATFPDHAYVSLDLPSEAALADEDPAAFLRRNPPPLVVDEVQYAPGLFRHLKAAIDHHRDQPGQFILTGSQRLPLMSNVTESLAGRVDVIELEGLTWNEIRAARPGTTLEEAVVRGGFPELYEKPELEADAWFRSYVATCLERDVRQLHAVGSLRDFERLLRAAALRTAGLLNKADLARDVGVSGPTAAAWLSVLQATGHVTLLEPWFSNATRSLTKSPKLYLSDSGLCAFLVGLHSPAELDASPLGGSLFETFAFSQLRRAQVNGHGGWSLWFWRDRSKEADFLLHRAGRFDLADAKLSTHPSARDTQPLRRVAAELPQGTVRSLSLLCRAPHPYPLGAGAWALPVGDPWPQEERA
ncbi:MAG: hypothetical protein AMXMBFR64_62650 [Myxococcales bacterium]